MNKRSHVLAAGMLVASVAACQQGEIEPTTERPIEQGLVLSSLTGSEIQGTFAEGAIAVEFRATELEPRVVEVDLVVGDQTLYAQIDLQRGQGFYDLASVVLDEEERAAIEALHLALDDALTGEHMTTVEDQLVRTTGFLGVAPVRTKLGTHELQNTKSWVHLSCGCYRKYIGSGYYRVAGKGSWCTGGYGNGCKGRCGSACGSTGRGAYTQDCAKHDYGLGSWWSASDDFAFASWNC